MNTVLDHQHFHNIPNMQFTSLFTALIMTAIVEGATVQFSTGLGCASFSQTFQGSCNFCADPPFDWSSILFSGIDGSNRVTVHNQDNCTPASQVGQGFGPACWNQGATKLRSAWVACPGQKLAGGNQTLVNDEATIVE
ncbi:asparaginase [Mycena sp. CBHHK59/15]|nr:asparaginase [Mycena sp. CBHHK59/15]